MKGFFMSVLKRLAYFAGLLVLPENPRLRIVNSLKRRKLHYFPLSDLASAASLYLIPIKYRQ
jgi:hypothetical protein